MAAFAGSVVLAIMLKEKSPGRLLAMVASNLFAAIFFGPLIVAWLLNFGFANVDTEALNNAAGAIAGISGMAIINGVLGVVRHFSAKSADKARGQDDDTA